MDTKLGHFPSAPPSELPARPPEPAAVSWMALNANQRVQYACMALGSAAILVVARLLTPDPRGLGTHQQLGLPPCFTFTTLHIPCPFCGMTTAFSLMAHGRIEQAFGAQPAGALAFVATLVVLFAGVVASLSGRLPVPANPAKWRRRVVATGAALVLAAWVYKMASVLAT